MHTCNIWLNPLVSHGNLDGPIKVHPTCRVARSRVRPITVRNNESTPVHDRTTGNVSYASQAMPYTVCLDKPFVQDSREESASSSFPTCILRMKEVCIPADRVHSQLPQGSMRKKIHPNQVAAARHDAELLGCHLFSGQSNCCRSHATHIAPH